MSTVHRSPRRSLSLTLLVALAVAAPALRARAQERIFVSLEAGAAIPLSAPDASLFQAGAAGAGTLGVAFDDAIAAGLRVGGGVLADARAPGNHLTDPGAGGWVDATLVFRARPLASLWHDGRSTTGPFLEVGAGGAITGTWMARPAFEGTVGWGIGVGDVVIVPSVGVTHLFSWDDPLGGVGAVMGRASLGIVLGDTPPPAPPEPEVPADVDFPDPPPVVDPCTQPDVDGSHAAAGCPVPPPVVLADRDHDGFLDDEDACPDQEETLNGVEDDDGCPDQGLVELHGDRVVLDDRVLFEFDRARVVRSARPILEAVVTMFQGHSQWDRVRVEGHADERGDDELNLALSERRARAVREQLVEMGVPEDRIDIAAYGESRLLDTETTEEAHARNRRVELVMIDDGGALPPARPEEQTR